MGSLWKASVAATQHLRDTREKHIAEDMAADKPTKEDIEKAFAKCDKDGNGKLTINEFKAALLEFIPEEERDMVKDDAMMEMLLDMVDGDGDKMVSLNELLVFISKDEKTDAVDEKEMFKRMIKAADKDGNGFLSAAEMKELLLKMNPGDAAFAADVDKNVHMFMMMASTDGDKKLKIEEAIKLFTDEEEEDPKEKTKTMFRMCDCDGDGYISKKEIVQFMKTMGFVDEDDTPAEVKMIINMTMSMADQDKDGKLNYEEFCKLMDKN